MSSDSDFTRLASRIREEGISVYGFGERKTPESFRQACTRFIYTENLLAQKADPNAAASAARNPSEASPLIERAISSMDEGGGWISLGAVGNQLRIAYPDFDQRTYGFNKLSDLVRGLDDFDLERQEPSGAIRVRRRTK